MFHHYFHCHQKFWGKNFYSSVTGITAVILIVVYFLCLRQSSVAGGILFLSVRPSVLAFVCAF